ncbi:sesquipedalian-1 [Tachyglossus aculeatus]|uniref:sesquipedalian-1 n=1 Tax=Tachyglossus aculeatus TaxID=9261 RepID=UPI0018F6D6CE|nr:sesquipedalian-1 [Tachyglossus aculeatus]XP_038619584.1 sesquipedalian-1 [Tachyglossus aculeatus]
MKLNERSLAFYATCDSPADNTGFLYKKGERHTAYHKRWFVLKGNMLFYFEDRDSREPVGVIILEGCTVELCEATEEFAFAIRFAGARSRTYVLAADSQPAMEAWVKALSRASFDYLRLVVRELEQQLEEVRGSEAGGKRAQRRSPAPRRSQPEPVAPPRRDRPVYTCPAGSKENGCAVWSTDPSAWPNGPGSGPRAARLSHDGSPQAPPLPPRRRPSGTCVQALAPESPFSPGTASFGKLHEWYGREIVELRREWLESQGQP